MKTFKELQESITKALIKFGSKGLRKIPKLSNTLNLKQMGRTNYLKTKYQNVNKYKFGPGQMMKQKMIGVEPGVEQFLYGSKKMAPILPRLAKQGKLDMFNANVNLQKNFTARQLDKLQGYKPTDMGPNQVKRHFINLSTGKGNKARKKAIDLLMKKIPKDK